MINCKISETQTHFLFYLFFKMSYFLIWVKNVNNIEIAKALSQIAA